MFWCDRLKSPEVIHHCLIVGLLNYSWVFANMFRHLVTHRAVWHFHNSYCQIKPERIVEHLRRNQSWPKFLNLESNQSGEHQCGHFPSDPWMGAHHYKLKLWRKRIRSESFRGLFSAPITLFRKPARLNLAHIMQQTIRKKWDAPIILFQEPKIHWGNLF